MKSFLFLIFFIQTVALAQDAINVAHYDHCSEATNDIVQSFYKDKLCTTITNVNSIKDMTKVKIYECTNITSAILRQYWLIDLQKCFIIQFDDYQIDTYYTITFNPYILLFNSIVITICLILYYFYQKKNYK